MKRALYAALALLPASLSCDRLCGDDSNANVAGEWTIRGEGQCAEREGISSDITIESAGSFFVSQTAGGDGLELSGSPPAPAGSSSSFTGNVHGSCVDFTWRESGDGYSIAYMFKGVIEGHSITGDLTGTGDGLCPFEGDFDVDIISTSAPRDGGVVVGDAGTSSTTPDAGPITSGGCHFASDCNAGTCQNGRCVVQCQVTSDCAVGQKCVSGRCDQAQGCNCNEHAPAQGSALMLALLGFAITRALRSLRTESIRTRTSRTRPNIR